MTVSLDPLPDLLRRTADLLRLSGAVDFKAAAWEKAAAVAEQEGDSLRFRASEKEMMQLPNVGKSLAAQLCHYLEHGELPQLKELESSLPGDLIRWLDVQGLGPKRAAKIHKELGISTLKELEEALADGRVAALPGFGKKSVRKLLNTLTWMEGAEERCLLSEAMDLAEGFMEALREVPGLKRLETAGSLRRSRETIGDLDFLACVEGDASDLHRCFCEHPDVTEVLGRGETKSSVRVKQGRQLDLRTVPESAFAAAWLYFTGSKEHNVFLRSRARERSLTLNEYGLYPLKDGEADREQGLELKEEVDIYAALNLPFSPPELRESCWQPAVEGDDLPSLVEEGDLQGVLHVHSTWSDGKNSIEEIAEAVRGMGFKYVGITDHSQSAFYAGGLKPEQVEAQWREIDDLNRRYKEEDTDFRIYKGIESDIKSDGSLDYEDDLLAGFDFVIASLHGQLDLEPEAQQARVEAALEHPATTLLGHPTARLLLRRPGSRLNMEKVVRLAAKKGVGIEINAAPPRFELDWRLGPLARETGLLTAICPDAHAVAELDRMIRYGIPLARKAGFAAERILNCRHVPEFAHG